MGHWDVFQDADKFEQLQKQQDDLRKSRLQAEFDVIKKIEEEERFKFAEESKTADLEASIVIATEKLEIKEKQLEDRLEFESQLKDENENLMIEIEERDREMIRMQNMLDQYEVLKVKYEVQATEQLTLINKLQIVSATS
jgi:hypothetical protein